MPGCPLGIGRQASVETIFRECIMNSCSQPRACAAPPIVAASLAWGALLVLSTLTSSTASACACGCGLFDVGTSSMYASHAGGMGFLEYDYMDQNRNWSGSASAPAANNADKRIRTRFNTAGAQYFFNRAWGVSIEVPYWQRDFRTTDDTGNVVDYSHGAMGDVRLKAVYTGFSADMSSGLTLGLKLANGETNYANFDPDTAIGTGSTDLLLGGYHLGRLSADNRWAFFLQGQLDAPVAHRSNYRPGAEGVVVIGSYYEGWQLTSALKLAPLVQLRAVYRLPDGGPDGRAGDSGYTRVLASPGIELAAGNLRANLDVAVPLLTNARGNQLMAAQLWKLNVGYHF
jgi:hypothetical protein